MDRARKEEPAKRNINQHIGINIPLVISHYRKTDPKVELKMKWLTQFSPVIQTIPNIVCNRQILFVLWITTYILSVPLSFTDQWSVIVQCICAYINYHWSWTYELGQALWHWRLGQVKIQKATKEILMEFTFNFYPSNPNHKLPLNISVGNENSKSQHTSRNGSKSWTTRFR